MVGTTSDVPGGLAATETAGWVGEERSLTRMGIGAGELARPPQARRRALRCVAVSDAPGGECWEQAQDGRWYAPGVLSGAGWQRAPDGMWYRPAPVVSPGDKLTTTRSGQALIRFAMFVVFAIAFAIVSFVVRSCA